MYKFLKVSADFARGLRCACPDDLVLGPGDRCVFEYDKLPEYGQVLAAMACGPDETAQGCPVVLRRATLQDQSRASENGLMVKSARRVCEAKIAELKMQMRMVLVHYSLDRARLTVFFTADDYVDFRQFVQDVAGELRTRVEMRQIGVRDAAGMIGGYAPCGRQLCCSSWIKKFDNVHIRMVKAQGLSLNAAAVNGMCGRLKCCLCFEHDCYLALGREMPAPGAMVNSPAGRGRVVSRNLLRRRVLVAMDANRVLDFSADDVTIAGRVAKSEK